MSLEQLRKDLEEKYNINLDIQTVIGEKTYWDLREYFTKEIEDIYKEDAVRGTEVLLYSIIELANNSSKIINN